MQSCLYEGLIRHRRFVPRERRFSYRLFFAYLDLDELDEVFAGRLCWSTRRLALAQFRRADHFGDPRLPLADVVRSLVLHETGTRPSGPIRLLTGLASAGYGFNPISLYFCFDDDDRQVEAVIAEVTNTPWGERHCYVLPSPQGNPQQLDWRFTKRLHVSPFMPPEISYRLRVRGPGQHLSVQLDAHRDEGFSPSGEPDRLKLLDATLTLERRPVTTAVLAKMLLRYPLLPQRIQARIHWQALKLWWSGHLVYPHQPHHQSSWELHPS
jgi:DUF1365 family protein